MRAALRNLSLTGLLCLFAGCGDSQSTEARTRAIVGRWQPPEQDGETIEFQTDGRWVGIWADGGPESRGTWSIRDDTLTLRVELLKGIRAAEGEQSIYRIERMEAERMYLRMPSGDVGEWRRVR